VLHSPGRDTLGSQLRPHYVLFYVLFGRGAVRLVEISNLMSGFQHFLSDLGFQPRLSCIPRKEEDVTVSAFASRSAAKRSGKEIDSISSEIRDVVFSQFRRRGALLGVFASTDSSMVAALCANALGKDRVLALLIAESEPATESLSIGQNRGR